jgi:hypothetical protein
MITSGGISFLQISLALEHLNANLQPCLRNSSISKIRSSLVLVSGFISTSSGFGTDSFSKIVY